VKTKDFYKSDQNKKWALQNERTESHCTGYCEKGIFAMPSDIFPLHFHSKYFTVEAYITA